MSKEMPIEITGMDPPVWARYFCKWPKTANKRTRHGVGVPNTEKTTSNLMNLLCLPTTFEMEQRQLLLCQHAGMRHPLDNFTWGVGELVVNHALPKVYFIFQCFIEFHKSSPFQSMHFGRTSIGSNGYCDSAKPAMVLTVLDETSQ